ncbi:hypothetical protein D9M71_767800 [compost metagenome]
MTTGNVADGECHGQHRQAKRQGNPEQTDADIRESSGQHRTAATTQHQPEGTYQLCSGTFEQRHERVSFRDFAALCIQQMDCRTTSRTLAEYSTVFPKFQYT